MSRTAKTACAFVAVFFIFLYFECLSPLGLDDYTFKNLLYDPWRIIGFAFKQYCRWDGRITGYMLNLSILYVPRLIADVVLALTSIGLIFAMIMHILGPEWKRTITWMHVLGVFCLLWISIPNVGQVFFWKTGSPYTIIPMLYLLLLWPYRLLAEQGHYRAGTFYAILPLAVFCGLADFHNTLIVAILTLAVSVYSTIRGKRYVAPYFTPLVLLIAFAVIYFAPGNALRIETTMPEFLTRSRWTYIEDHLANQGTIQSYYFWEYLLLVLAGFGIWRYGRRVSGHNVSPYRSQNASGLCAWIRRYGLALLAEAPLCAAMVFFLTAQGVQLIFMFAPLAEPRVFTSSVIFMIIAVLIVAQYVAERFDSGLMMPSWRLFWIPAGAVCLINLGMAAVMYYDTHLYILDFERKVLAAKPEDHVLVNPCPYQSGPYLYHGINFGVQDDWGWGNRQIARYYNLSSIRLVPQRFSLLAEGAGVRFQGQADNAVLSFTYTPSPADAGKPFVFAFPPLPKDLARKWGQTLANRYLKKSSVFPAFVHAVYTSLKPDFLSRNGVITGTVKLPRLDHASEGYIMHSDPRSGAVTSLIPLAIARR